MFPITNESPLANEPAFGLKSHEMVLGVKVVPLVFGMARFSATGPQNPETGLFPASHVNDAAEQALLHDAIAQGYNFFDTAQAYGDSEFMLGRVLKDYSRKNFIVATKVGIRPDPDIRGSIRQSVDRLGTVPDILFVHNRWQGQMEQEMDNCLAALDEAVDQGYAREIGISNFQPHELEMAISKLRHKPLFYQAKLNLVNPRKDATDTLAICEKNGVTFMASSALDRGGVTGDTLNPVVLDVAKKYNMSPAQVAIFAVRSLGSLPLVQTHNLTHLKENLDTLSFSMKQTDIDNLKNILLRKV
ncbi:MAG: aldo/keto reductase [Candidatus Shapirobacteria bacterium]|jgi:aryl-alcohol dehydrogenase-like predicted oxidoreductase